MQEHVAFNNLDYIVLGIILISGLLALMRGFVREALSLASWAGAIFLAAHYYPLLEPMVHQHIKTPEVVSMVSSGLIFVAALIVFTIVSYIISGMIRGEALTAIDRSLGFVFGILRGVLFVGVLYLVVQTVVWPSLETAEPGQESVIDSSVKSLQDVEKKEKDPAPQWIIQAKTFPAMKYTAKIMKSFLPQKMIDKANKELLNDKKATQKVIDDKALEMLSTPTAGINPTVQQPGYTNDTRSDLNRKVNQ